ncbi:AsmA-like C-terminal region-containing protein [Granulicella sp. dw_53]|uniref:AsmA-like C-terminal region-containing protein n=1 Tax=Granulicella sp. dw_53 TaxID=2719792 RepID=UPI001BD62639|nr:AsmA-like C-terminal region-containing protein [Granulicella sp. dw_53]
MQVGSYKRFYFPHPGFVAHKLVLRLHGSTDIPPLATVDTLTATGSYLDFIFAPRHLHALSLVGLHVQIPPSGAEGNGTKYLSGSSGPNTTVVDQITADQSELEVTAERGKPPVRFFIHTLTLRDVSGSKPMSYEVAFRNPIPVGELRAQGRLGPLKRSDLGSTPLSGRSTLTDLDLGVFHGISGKLQGENSFHGLLSRVEITGSTDIPDFRVGEGQPEHLATRFHAYVNGMEGSVALDRVQAVADRTRIDVSGDIDRKRGSRFAFQVKSGRIQDLMRMFARDGAPLTGAAVLHGDAFVPPEHEHFLKALQMSGTFVLSDLHFTHSQTQQTIDGFSQRASGTAPKKKNADMVAPTVLSELKVQRVVLRDGVAKFTDLLFAVPGANADGSGTFNLLNKQVDVMGTLRMDTNLSNATTGIKSFLLKPVDPLFKKKQNGTVAPVHLSGTYSHPMVGLRLPGDKK